MQCDLGNATYMQVLLTPMEVMEVGVRKLIFSRVGQLGLNHTTCPRAITVLMGRAMSGTEKCICQ